MLHSSEGNRSDFHCENHRPCGENNSGIFPPMNVERWASGTCSPPFPVYDDVVGRLLAAHGAADAGRDAVVAHVLGTCAGYAYADIETLAMFMARLGLERSACVRIAQTVDAMYIYSTAYLVQSSCGRAAIWWSFIPRSTETSAPRAWPSSTN